MGSMPLVEYLEAETVTDERVRETMASDVENFGRVGILDHGLEDIHSIPIRYYHI